MSIYKEVPSAKANRINGEVYSVPNSRRIRPAVKSARKSGGTFGIAYPIGQSKLKLASRSRNSR